MTNLEEDITLTHIGRMDLANTKYGAVQRTKHKIYNTINRISGLKLPPSPTPHLLNSNYAPTEEEIPLILDTILQAELEANRLGVALASKRTTGVSTLSANLLKAHLDMINKHLIGHKAILSPIRRLPPEVLEEIFAFSISDCESGKLGSQDFNRSSHSIPQNQTHVCKLWKSVALSNPRFWSQLPTIRLDRSYSKSPQFLAFLADVLERRSGDIPINFHLVTRKYRSVIYESHAALALLVSHSTKWKTANLDLWWVKEEELLGIMGRIPLLETLILSFCSYRDHNPPMLGIFQNAPQLRKALVVRGGSTRFLLPNHRLIHYRDDGLTTQCDDFSPFTSLHTLEIGEHCFPDGVVVKLTNLSVLRVKMISYNLNPLDLFILPALRELSICCFLHGRFEVDLIQPILALVLRAEQPSLMERLHVRSGLMEPGKLSLLLQQVPLLTHLNIDLPPVVDVERLISTIDPLVPLLQVCSFYCVGMLDDHQASLCRQLALARGEVSDEYMTMLDTPIYDHPVRCALHIDFNYCTPNSQQRVLHGWMENDTTNTLKNYRRSLINHLYKKVRPPDLPSLLSGDYYTNITLSTLNLTQRMAITRAEDLYISGILRMIYHIIAHFPSNTESWKESFCQKSELILEKWKPIIEASFDDFKWGIDGRRIFYIPRNSPFRKSPGIMTKIIAEQYRQWDIREVDPPWPVDDWK